MHHQENRRHERRRLLRPQGKYDDLGRGWTRVKLIILSYPTAPLELIAGLSAIMRGIWFIMPWDATNFDTEKLLQSFISKELFGCNLIFLGLLQLYVTAYRKSEMKLLASSFQAMATAFMFGCYIATHPTLLPVPLYGTMLIIQLWICLRATTNSDLPFAPKREVDFE